MVFSCSECNQQLSETGLNSTEHNLVPCQHQQLISQENQQYVSFFNIKKPQTKPHYTNPTNNTKLSCTIIKPSLAYYSHPKHRLPHLDLPVAARRSNAHFRLVRSCLEVDPYLKRASHTLSCLCRQRNMKPTSQTRRALHRRLVQTTRVAHAATL